MSSCTYYQFIVNVLKACDGYSYDHATAVRTAQRFIICVPDLFLRHSCTTTAAFTQVLAEAIQRTCYEEDLGMHTTIVRAIESLLETDMGDIIRQFGLSAADTRPSICTHCTIQRAVCVLPPHTACESPSCTSALLHHSLTPSTLTRGSRETNFVFANTDLFQSITVTPWCLTVLTHGGQRETYTRCTKNNIDRLIESAASAGLMIHDYRTILRDAIETEVVGDSRE